MKKRVILLFLLISAVFTVSVCSVSAQDIDIDNMNNEQLMGLLQAIMQKLESNETQPDAEQNVPEETGEPSAAVSSQIPESTPEPVKEKARFHIYETKKLIVGRLPDSMFIREKPGSEEDDEPAAPTCPPGATYECYTDILTGEYKCGCGYG